MGLAAAHNNVRTKRAALTPGKGGLAPDLSQVCQYTGSNQCGLGYGQATGERRPK